MSMVEAIVEHLRLLPTSRLTEVLAFVKSLSDRSTSARDDPERTDWSALSLEQAMRGLENEPPLYSVEDLKERF